MSDCIFCKILDGEIPSAKIYEDDDVYAFLDISQVTEGHTLVIPKKHCEDVFDLDEDTAAKLFKAVPNIARGIRSAFNPQGLNMLNNNGSFADQSVFHVHLHLIPRYDESDGFKSKWQTHGDDYTPEQLQNIAQSISNEI
ncbi:HIT family protein [Alkalibacillus salilacus]|uniref:Histidine triad (HIT) family protein n=1 Tax=Alkalibacillus salilacus TaxID=284582 RepID=A0ABT9VGB1_9BACI|nr:HIT family protein [Alkalibacillus salilacus]MDQ0159932.1 histidine triad (HIT) family protein [Alkalibacillus salilacus]